MTERVVFWYKSVLRDLDLLKVGQSTMVALAKLSEAVLGTGVSTSGLAVTPGGELTVAVAPGQIYELEPLEATAISALVADTAHQIVKQGLILDAATVSGFTAPGTVGQSINYLLECQYQDFDTASTTLYFYNAANPAVQFTGFGNDGLPNTTIRRGIVAFQVKAGTAAATGTQTTPSTDSGWTALAVVTVAYGQSVIITANITSPAVPVPAIPITIPGIPAAIQTGQWVSWQDTGAANAMVITPVPSLPNPLIAGTQARVHVAYQNTTSTTLDVKNGQGPIACHRNDGTLAQSGDFVLGMEVVMTYDGSYWQYVPSPNAWATSTPVDTGSAFAFQVGYIQ